MNRKIIISAERGWYVENGAGHTFMSSPVIAWAFDAGLRPEPITAEGIATDGELISPEGKRHRVG